jgi:predicted RNase H-like nuclease (RuvC/YqgF family)
MAQKQEASASASPLPRRGSREWAERVEKAEAERERLRSELERARRECDALHSRRKEVRAFAAAASPRVPASPARGEAS